MEIVGDRINRLEKEDIKSISEEELADLKKSYFFAFINSFLKNINGKTYHVKHREKNELEYIVNELLGQIICEYFNLPVKRSSVYKDRNGFFLVTDNFIEKEKKYRNISTDIFPNLIFDGFGSYGLSIDNLNNFDRIRDTSGKDILKTDECDLKTFLYNLKGMIISDFIRNQRDRICRNFMVELNNNHVKLCPLYDFEYSFLLVNKIFVSENVFLF